MHYKVVLLLSVFLLSFFPLIAQNNYKISIQSNENLPSNFIKQRKFKDSTQAKKAIDKQIFQLQKKGYLLAAIDSITQNHKEIFYHLHFGEKFKNAHLQISDDDLTFLRKKAHLTEKYLNNLPFTPNEVIKVKKTIHKALENNGYPFASVELDSLTFDENKVSAQLIIHKGTRMKWGKINIIGDGKLSQKLISSYIQIKEGDWFNQEALDLIPNRISLLSFVEEVKPAEILFTPWGVELYLYLNSKKVSSADGILGLQPRQNGKGYKVTGELRLKLVNQLKIAESFDFQWRSIQKQTQALDIQLNFPNLFNSRFGFDGNFNLYKRDSTFLDIHFQLGVQYALNNGSYAKFYYRNENSSILQTGLNNPDFTDLSTSKTHFYGLSMVKQTINYLPNPTKGYIVKGDFSVGLRKTQHPDSSNFVKNTTFRLLLDYQHYITLHKRNVLKIGLVGKYLIAPRYYENELFRFGGQFLQRGFNEEQLRADLFGTATIEYRFLVDKNSYAFAFYDQSFYRNTIRNSWDYPFGFGVGFTYGTKIGSFSISYALGKLKDSNIRFQDGKIHFGYIAFF